MIKKPKMEPTSNDEDIKVEYYSQEPMSNDEVKNLLKENLKGQVLKKALAIWNLSLKHQTTVSKRQTGMIEYHNPYIIGELLHLISFQL